MRVRNIAYLIAAVSIFAVGVATSDQVKSTIAEHITAYANTAIANNPVNVHVNQNTSGGGGKNNNKNDHKNNNNNKKNNNNNKKDDKKVDKKDVKLDKKDIRLDKKDIKLDKQEQPIVNVPAVQPQTPQAITVENNNNNENNNTNEQHVTVEQPQQVASQPEIVTVSEGGQPVYSAPVQVETTPSTGPESLPLLGLLPTGLLGVVIRKRIASLYFKA